MHTESLYSIVHHLVIVTISLLFAKNNLSFHFEIKGKKPSFLTLQYKAAHFLCFLN